MAYQWKEQLNRLMKAWATYADVRYYPKDDSLFMLMLNGNMLSFGQGRESGFGVRVLADGAWGFAASSNMADITGTFDKALSNARAAAIVAYSDSSPQNTQCRLGIPDCIDAAISPASRSASKAVISGCPRRNASSSWL